MVSVLVAVAVFLAIPWLIVVGLVRLIDRVERARLEVVRRQMMLTDAIHGEFGAIVAPVLAKRGSGRWRIFMALSPQDLALAGRLTAIAHQVLRATGAADEGIEVVFSQRGRDHDSPARLLVDRSRASVGRIYPSHVPSYRARN
jgi:hypothetical protein